MTPWEIALRYFFGLILVLAGGALFLLARLQEEIGEDVSWLDWAVNIVIGLIGLGMLILADRVLVWTSLPNMLRWTTIGLILGASVVCYLHLYTRADRSPEKMSINRFIIQLMAGFALFILGMNMALAEFGVELP